jgi:hypothetical protein
MSRNKYYRNGIRIFAVILVLICRSGISFAQEIQVKGTVVEVDGKTPLPYVNVFVPGTTVGTRTDANGKYTIGIAAAEADSLRFAFLGYKTVTLPLSRQPQQVMNVRLQVASRSLTEVVVKAGKKERYRNKDNPAVELIRLVIDHKAANRIDHYDYLHYNQYEKLEFALSNLSEKVKNNRLVRKYKFIFDNQDTTKMEGKSLLPVYLEETISDVYYRRNPEKKKTIVTADKKVSFEEYIDNQGLSAYLNHIYQNVDIYDNNMMLFTNQFLSPIANSAPTFYKYFISDTIVTDKQEKLIVLDFMPRNKADFLLQGKLYITLDGNYAIQKADITASKEVNLNWVREFKIQLEFEQTADHKYYMSKSTMQADFGIFKGRGGIYGERTVSVKDFVINDPQPDDFYKGPALVKPESAGVHADSFWVANRHDTLTTAESKVYANIDSLQHMRSFKRTMDIATLLLAGYKGFGPVEVGPVNTFYSFNPVEGFRLRLGGRTTPKFNKNIYLESYAAYGFKDEKWKYYFGGTYSFTGRSPYEFPISAIRANFQRDTKIPGQELQFVQEDNFLLSFKRGNNDKWLYNDIFNLDYLHEFNNHFSIQPGFKNWKQSPAGSLEYIKEGPPYGVHVQDLTTTELSLELRWAPHEQFYQGKVYRVPIPNKYPIFTLRGIAGVKGLFGGQYNYQNVSLNIYKMAYLSQLGFSEIVLEGGYIFGKLPFPLLTIHRANQSYAYQLQSYNLMNFLEFVSDRYVSLNIDHNFNGFIFNKIPLLKKLKFREVVAVKALYGGIRDENRPENNPGLYRFPVDAQGVPITYSLDKMPYIEGSIGIANIFKLFRIDLVKRFTYLDHPGVSELGIRGRFKLDF